jgi:hypothetical protein
MLGGAPERVTYFQEKGVAFLVYASLSNRILCRAGGKGCRTVCLLVIKSTDLIPVPVQLYALGAGIASVHGPCQGGGGLLDPMMKW